MKTSMATSGSTFRKMTGPLSPGSLRIWAIVPLIGCSIHAARATPLPGLGVFEFSSLCLGPEDASGDKIVLIRETEGSITAIYWRAEGSIMEPLLAYGSAVKIDDKTGVISMRFVDRGLQQVYLLTGKISADELDVTSNVEGYLHLPRQFNEPARLPMCAPGGH